ncbi:hypothetical protein WR25_01478 [Diploscapter pachys]|uniref:HTH asnC-type domain-containing protein n=1 Tax=Diploscapter pachys TaxID=2018661 RepID=A0A2A2K9D7_9BILA|nr:hypothetical protein WR25_01478 [Diploscapter pachys]
MSLGPFDRALLDAVQRDASTSQIDLGVQVNLSSAAVNRRLKKLTQDGVIQRTVAQVDPLALGYTLTVITEVEVENERLDLLDAMKRTFMACPQVQQCYYVAGACDFVLIMLVRDMAQYTQLTRELFFQSNNVKRFKTLVSMSNVKTGLQERRQPFMPQHGQASPRSCLEPRGELEQLGVEMLDGVPVVLVVSPFGGGVFEVVQ